MSEAPNRWDHDVEVMIDAERIAARTRELGQEITAFYKNSPVCVISILKGSVIFAADLVRALDLPLSMEFVGISSYGNETESSGVVQITADLTRSIEGLDVLIVEDIIDTGLTMRYLLENLATRHPKSLRVCTLLHKPEGARVKVPMDWVGFTIPNAFVIGYGLDYAGLYRNLPYIGVYRGPTSED